MAQIKVLNLDDVCSLSELNPDDAQSIKGGTVTVWHNGRKTKVRVRLSKSVRVPFTRRRVRVSWTAGLANPA